MKYKLSEIAEIVAGGTPSTKNSAYWNGKISWITPKDLSTNKKRYISQGERNITEQGLNNSSAVMLPKNSILFTSRAPIGYIAISENEVCTNQGFKSLVCDDSKCYFLYLYYWLLNNIDYIKSQANGSTFQEISGNVMKKIEIDLPNINTQKKIAKILDYFDKKIELNNQINDNFYKVINILYNEKIINNNDKILKKMSELVEKTIGGDWGKEESTGNYNSEVLCIRGADIPEMDSGNKGKAPNRFILEKNLKSRQLFGEEIVIEISGGSPTQSTGRCTYITKELEKAFDKPLICTNFCRAIRLVDNKYLPSFYMNLKYLYNKNIMFLYENGTTGIKNLDLISLLENEEINIVDEKTLREFNEVFYIINKKIIRNASENRTLEQLRDTLLPKLMNGEIDLDKIEI